MAEVSRSGDYSPGQLGAAGPLGQGGNETLPVGCHSSLSRPRLRLVLGVEEGAWTGEPQKVWAARMGHRPEVGSGCLWFGQELALCWPSGCLTGKLRGAALTFAPCDPAAPRPSSGPLSAEHSSPRGGCQAHREPLARKFSSWVGWVVPPDTYLAASSGVRLPPPPVSSGRAPGKGTDQEGAGLEPRVCSADTWQPPP